MKIRAIGWVRRIGPPAVAFALLLPVHDIATAAEVDRRIPVIRDGAGSDVSVEIQNEGSRSTARPCFHASKETVERMEARIGGKIDAWKGPDAGAEASAPDAGASDTDASPCSIGTLRRRAAGAKVSRAFPPGPGEITVRDVKGFLKSLRASRKGKPAAAIVPEVPERRLGMADGAPSETN